MVAIAEHSKGRGLAVKRTKEFSRDLCGMGPVAVEGSKIAGYEQQIVVEGLQQVLRVPGRSRPARKMKV